MAATRIRPQTQPSDFAHGAPRSQAASVTPVRSATIGPTGPLSRMASAKAEPEQRLGPRPPAGARRGRGVEPARRRPSPGSRAPAQHARRSVAMIGLGDEQGARRPGSRRRPGPGRRRRTPRRPRRRPRRPAWRRAGKGCGRPRSPAPRPTRTPPRWRPAASRPAPASSRRGASWKVMSTKSPLSSICAVDWAKRGSSRSITGSEDQSRQPGDEGDQRGQQAGRANRAPTPPGELAPSLRG